MLGAGKLNNLFTIDCGEILLREFRVEDVDDIYSITSQPEVNEFLLEINKRATFGLDNKL